MSLVHRIFLEMLQKRLAQPDCLANGWLLDGFPHTSHQAQELRQRGIEPDKVWY
jgi:adenylate kinase family enzyme